MVEFLACLAVVCSLCISLGDTVRVVDSGLGACDMTLKPLASVYSLLSGFYSV